MRDWKKTPASYMLVHKKTGRTYVGSSENPVSRLWGHFENALNKGDSYNDLYIDMRRDGLTAFRWGIVETYDDEASMRDGELRLIAELVNAGKPVYNKRSTKPFKQFDSDVVNPYVQPQSVAPTKTKEKIKPRNHLTSKQMALVVLLVEEGIQQWYIAEMFNVVQSTISKALLKMGAREKGKKK